MVSSDPEATTSRVIGCAIEVHRALGPGLLESAYRECLQIELRHNSLRFDCELQAPITYREQVIRTGLKIDLLVEGCVVIELKAIEQIHPVHLAQVMTYLILSSSPIGLLMNFNASSIRKGLRRLDHPKYHAVRPRPLLSDPL
jgi:GxxExxY protein